MFGTLSDRLRKWLGVSPWPPETNAAANALLLPEPRETGGSSGNSDNGLSNFGSATAAVDSSGSISLAAEQVKMKESLNEAPGVTKSRGASQTAD